MKYLIGVVSDALLPIPHTARFVVMKSVLLILALVLATAAFAHQGVKDPQVMARMELMKSVSQDMKVLGDMQKGVTAYDARKARNTATSLKTHANETIRLFAIPASDPKSEALPEIWTNFPDFVGRVKTMVDAAAVLEASSEADFSANFTNLAKACSNCHKSYRQEN